MIIKNLTVGVINIEGKFVLPQQSVTVSDALKKNVVIKNMIKAGTLKEIVEVKKEEPVVEQPTADSFADFMGTKPTLTKLKAYAKKSGIELGDAKTEEEIVAVIKACLAITM